MTVVQGLTLLHQDARLLAVHKPAGLLVHPSALDAQATEDALTLLQTGLGRTLWPVHRLDKGTSGVLVMACDAEAARHLGEAFALGRCSKHYQAVVRGWPPAEGRTDDSLARDPELPSAGQTRLAASTCWRRRQRLELPLASHPAHATTRLALVDVTPLTGRRHQIRRHFKALAHPLIGDTTHGKGPLNRLLASATGVTRLWLHATHLTLPHPDDGQPLTLRAEPGAEWAVWQRWALEAPADAAG